MYQELQHHDRRHRSDPGFTLVEILIVIVIIGVLATVTVLAIRGTTSKAESNACDNEHRSMVTAVESYFVKESTDVIAATGTGTDRFERTMVTAEILRVPSSNWEVAADGQLTAQGGGLCI